MKRINYLLLALLFAFSTVITPSLFAQETNVSTVQKDSLISLIQKKIPGAKITAIDVAKPYLFKFEVMVPQQIDHNDAKSETFDQLVYISHRGFDCPTVVVTEGYGADYAEPASYNEELCKILKANLIFVEHRYFGKSKPTSMDYKHLTIKQAAADHHMIIKRLKSIYPKQWIATGTSKGGSTALYLKAYYPNDVDAVVAYVAPITNAQEDSRPIDFIINKAGTAADRKLITDYQLLMFKHFDDLLSQFNEYAKKMEFEFTLGNTTTLEYLILEYPFSHWQWGVTSDKIPTKKDDTKTMLDHLIRIVDPSGYSKSGSDAHLSYYYQAYSEVGYYNYNAYIPIFKKYLKLKSYSNDVLVPKGAKVEYHPESHNEVVEILNKTGVHILQIVGELDPWRQSAWIPNDQTELPVFVLKNGNHGVRIAYFDTDTKSKIYDTLELWLGIKVRRL